MKYLDFYFDCMETGRLPSDGLCNSLRKEAVELFVPTTNDEAVLEMEGKPIIYWGYGKPKFYTDENNKNRLYEFTGLRQTIVLFLAAMEGEL